MKNVIILLIVLSFMSCQKNDSNIIKPYLNKNDVDIFIINFDQIYNDLKNYDKSIFDRYRYPLTYSSEEIFAIEDLIDGKIILSYKEGEYYQDLINSKIPEQINKVFKNIGWENNGGKKYFTIINIFGYLQSMSTS